MTKRFREPQGPSDDRVRVLLDRYACPVPFHAVRTRFLGNIASPLPTASPIAAMEELWGGELPTFETIGAANELVGALINGLWNRLTRHQERSAPFRLVRIEVPATRAGLERIALVRREEIDGFVEGLFGKEEALDLPERAHRAMTALSEARAILEGARALAADPTKPASAESVAGTIPRIREMTRVVEREMHEAVLACKRARAQILASLPVAKPVLH